MSDMTIHVLIVDDDAEQREDLTEWLRREGMSVIAADSGETALALLKEGNIYCEILLADQLLGQGMDGLTLLKRVKEEYPDLVAVLFSGRDPGSGLEALRVGAYRYISKPYSLEELTFVVQQAVEYQRVNLEIAEIRRTDLKRIAEQHEKELSALLEINQAVVSLKRENFLRLINEKSIQVIPGEYSELWSLDQSDDLVLESAWGVTVNKNLIKKELGFKTLKHDEPSIGMRVVSTRTAYICEDFEKEAAPDPIYAEARSSLTVPLVYQGKVRGVLNVESKYKNVFSTENTRILQAFAEQAMVAITNAEMYDQIQQQKFAQIKAIGEITKAITISEKPVSEILQKMLDSTLALIANASLGEVRLIEGDYLIVAASSGATVSEEYTSLPIGKGITGWVALHGESQLVTDTTKDRRYVEFLTSTRSEIDVPMKVGEKVIGVFFVEHPQVDAFTQDHLKLVEAMAGLATVAITNAELYKHLQQQRDTQITTIQVISAAIANLEKRDELLGKLLDSTLTLMANASWSSIRLIEGNDLVLKASRGKIAAGSSHISISDGISGWVAKHGEPQLILDVGKDSRYLKTLAETRSEIAVPMKIGESVIGVLNIEHPQVNSFTEDHLKLAEAMAGLATVAIENARLYQQRLKDIAALQEINTAITQKPLNEVAQLIVQKAAELTDGEFSGLWLMDEERKGLRFGAMYGIEPKELWIPLDDKSFNGYVALTGITFYCGDLSITTHYYNWYGNFGSRLGTPMKYQNTIVGTLYVHSPRFDAFTDYHAQLLESLAAQAAIALENTRLLAETRRSLQKRTEILGNLGSSLADLEVEI